MDSASIFFRSWGFFFRNFPFFCYRSLEHWKQGAGAEQVLELGVWKLVALELEQRFWSWFSTLGAWILLFFFVQA